MTSQTADIVIVGGGIIGSATAYRLVKMDDRLKVTVVEKDPTYAKASSTLSMANVRVQFDLAENILISKYAQDILTHFETEMAVEDRDLHIGFRQEGNLFVLDEGGQAAAQSALAMQNGLGCATEMWPAEKIQSTFPLYDMNGYVGGTYGATDGHFDAYAVLMGYRAKAISLGARYVQAEVNQLLHSDGKMSGVRLDSGETITSQTVINCAGAWAAEVAKTCGVALPIDPTVRQVFCFEPKVKPQTPLPLTILPSGLYFRTETGGMILVGKSLPEDPIGFELVAHNSRFMEHYWPEIAAFVPVFEDLRLIRGWAGLYAMNTLDGNAILGPWPTLQGLYLANGFSGHGLQQAPAVGRYLSELILGRQLSLDLSIFDPGRILENRPLTERETV